MELEDNRPSESAGYFLTAGQDGNYGDVIEGEDQRVLVLFSNVGGTISSYYKVEVSYDMLQFAVN